MSETGRPWWADVQHLRPAEDREREQHARDTHDAALRDVRDPAGADRATSRERSAGGRFDRAAEERGSLATMEHEIAPRPERAPLEPGVRFDESTFEDELATWLDQPPAQREREIELIVDEPLPVEPPRRRAERFTTDDWLALTAPDEHVDPDNGRRTVEIRGQIDAPRSITELEPDPVTGAPSTARAAAAARGRAPRGSIERLYGRPDRVAMWAFVLGIILILVALIGTPNAEAATRLGDRPLKAGMDGRDVRHLQLRLKRVGFLDAPATARFGALTKRAVKRYQRSRCLTADGIVGPSTVRALRQGRRACRKAGKSRGKRASGSRRKAYRRVDLGARTLAKGMRGRDVRTLQQLLGLGSDGVFGAQTKRAVRRFQRRAGLTADGAVGPATRVALANRKMRARRATWYGPGLYGNRTACGQKMTRRLRGVAHKKLPCGTRVLLHYGGRFVTARVVDRGPYANGATFDLTAATARQIGLSSTDRINARY
jgi:peptidoglycan hydrolase-like protein with peptidoglycan-binding domain